MLKYSFIEAITRLSIRQDPIILHLKESLMRSLKCRQILFYNIDYYCSVWISALDFLAHSELRSFFIGCAAVRKVCSLKQKKGYASSCQCVIHLMFHDIKSTRAHGNPGGELVPLCFRSPSRSRSRSRSLSVRLVRATLASGNGSRSRSSGGARVVERGVETAALDGRDARGVHLDERAACQLPQTRERRRRVQSARPLLHQMRQRARDQQPRERLHHQHHQMHLRQKACANGKGSTRDRGKTNLQYCTHVLYKYRIYYCISSYHM